MDNFETPLDSPEVQPETVAGDNVTSPKCQVMVANRMQCPRLAEFVSPDKVAVCGLHYDLAGQPKDFKAVERKAGL